MQVIFEAVVTEDNVRHYPDGEQFYPVGGGAYRPPGIEPNEGFNVRNLSLKATGEPVGDLSAALWMMPGGIALIGSGPQAASFAGKRVTITIEEVVE